MIFQFPPSSPSANCCAIGPSARLSAIPSAIIKCSDIVLECSQSFPRSYDCVSDAERPQQDQVQSDTPRILRLFCAASGLRLCPCCLSYLTYDPMVTDLLGSLPSYTECRIANVVKVRLSVHPVRTHHYITLRPTVAHRLQVLFKISETTGTPPQYWLSQSTRLAT